MLGIRILLQRPPEAEYAQDYEILWSYEGPNAVEAFQQKIEDLEFDNEYLVQVKETDGIWRTYDY